MTDQAAAVLFVLVAILIGMARPTVLVVLALSAPWILPAFAPASLVGPAQVALALMALVSVQLRSPRDPAMRRTRIPHGLVFLGVILGVAVLESFFVESDTNFLILTSGASIPLAYLSLYYVDPRSRATQQFTVLLAYASALLPAGLAIGVIDRDDLNPILVGNTAWAGMLLMVGLRSRLRLIVWLPLAIISGIEWVTTDQIGPRLAGSIAVLVFVLKQMQLRSTLSALERRLALRRRTLTVMAIGLSIVGVVAVQQVSGEWADGGRNNTTLREAGWRTSFDNIRLIGGGVRQIETEVAGEAVQFGSHNFLVDAAAAAGVVGLILIGLVIWKAIEGALRGQHVLIPYCVGIMVANSFSGGLFRAPTLWFALTLLMGIQYEVQRSKRRQPAPTRSTGLRVSS